MNSGWLKFLALFALAVCASAAWTHATTVGTDNASNYSSWSSGSNAGSGFLSWTLNQSQNNAGFFLGDSKNVAGGSGADINSTGNSRTQSFGMYGTFPGNSDAYRTFDGQLLVGQSFSLDLAVNFRNGNKGFEVFRDSTATSKVFNFNIGGDDYRVNNALTGNGSIGNGYSSNAKFHVTFTQSTSSGGSWSIDRTGSVTSNTSGTYDGILGSLHLYTSDTDGSNSSALYFNNLGISGGSNPTPEAASSLLFGSGMLSLLGARRRKNADMIASV